MTQRARMCENLSGWIEWFCPGCKEIHRVPVQGGARGMQSMNPWAFNANFERPTLEPSVKLSDGPGAPGVYCHCVITDGRVAFCEDSRHALARQTVDLPELV